jgi:acylglycerol lipase
MVHSTYFKSWKQRNIYFQEWMPEQAPVAMIGILHGQSDHSSRFSHVAAFFTHHGYGVMAIDLIGHGRSEGKRGHVDRFDDYLDLADELIRAMMEKSDKPIYLYGHSMGGLIALAHASNRSGRIKGYIVTSPLLRLAFDPPAWRIKLGRMVMKLIPDLVQPATLDVGFISHSEEEQQKYKADKLVHGKITPAAFFGILDAGEALLKAPHAIHTPVLAIHGTGDKITDHTATRELAAGNPSWITHVEFSGLYHEIHNEPERDELFQTELSWIEKIGRNHE